MGFIDGFPFMIELQHIACYMLGLAHWFYVPWTL